MGLPALQRGNRLKFMPLQTDLETLPLRKIKESRIKQERQRVGAEGVEA